MWPREAEPALFRQAVHSRLPTRPLPDVDGFEFVLRSGWSGMGRRGFGRRRRSTRNVAMSQPTGNPVASLPFSQRQVRILRPVVQTFMRAVFHVRHDLAFGRPVGAQFVGDHTLWRHALFLQKSRQQALGRLVGALTVMGALLPQFPYRSINVTVPSHQPIRRRERIMSASSQRDTFSVSFPYTTRSPTSLTFPATIFHPPTIKNCEQLPCKHGAKSRATPNEPKPHSQILSSQR
ncbi:hypothetical protein ACVINI_005822 [Rhizobium beringeri]